MEQTTLIQQLLDVPVLLESRYNTIDSDVYSFGIINNQLYLIKNGQNVLHINLSNTLTQESTIFYHKDEYRFELILSEDSPLKHELFNYFVINTKKTNNRS